MTARAFVQPRRRSLVLGAALVAPGAGLSLLGDRHEGGMVAAPALLLLVLLALLGGLRGTLVLLLALLLLERCRGRGCGSRVERGLHVHPEVGTRVDRGGEIARRA